jgi:hypothetical protein
MDCKGEVHYLGRWLRWIALALGQGRRIGSPRLFGSTSDTSLDQFANAIEVRTGVARFGLA